MKKYPRTLHAPWSPCVHDDDKTHSSMHAFVGKRVVVTEKIDGGNTTLYNGDVYARSVTMPASDGWFAMVKKHHAWKTYGVEKRFIGEDIYGVHSIEYDAVAQEDTFQLFAVVQDRMFLDWDTVCRLANEYSMCLAPVVFDGVIETVEELKQIMLDVLKKPSALGGECEGSVVRVAEAFHEDAFSECVAKIVRPDHVQTDQHWRKNWQACRLIGS